MGSAIRTQQQIVAVTDAPETLKAVFPETYLGAQLRMAARLIAGRETLQVRRQIFFCALDGFDTHGSQLSQQNQLLTDLNAALGAFYQATVELGVSSQVTTFTASDFGRTLTSSGDGTDHGWGGHHLVVGGAVAGQKLYGQFPVVADNGPDDVAQGRLIPTTSVDEYVATLARWFGVAESDLTATVVPNLGRFASRDLGFMG